MQVSFYGDLRYANTLAFKVKRKTYTILSHQTSHIGTIPLRADTATDRDSEPSRRKSHALRGAFVGALIGVIVVWRVVAAAIDPSVTDHKSMFPAAVMFVCIAACFAFGICTLLGAVVGYCFKKAKQPLQSDTLETP